jgi:mitofilin
MLEEGDLDGAAREMNTLQGWAGVLSKDWLQECRKVLEVRQALDVSFQILLIMSMAANDQSGH